MIQYVNYVCIIENEFRKLKGKYIVKDQHQKHWKIRSDPLKIHPTKLENNFAPVAKDLGSRTLGISPLDGHLMDISHKIS